MREAQFLKQNAEKWNQYEQELKHFDNPDSFANRFIELTDDLAYAKTFYPKSNTASYLNGLVTQFHQKIYKNKKEKSGRVINFWRFELPFLFKQYHPQLLYAFLFFIFFAFMGGLSAKYDDSFVRLVLGDTYVNMTNENIEKGDPFGVYNSSDGFSMFIQIAFNNIWVSFVIFVMGIFFSVGTVYHLFRNGLMIGAFMEYFMNKGLGLRAFLAVFIHGTIELSVIVIAGCAGLVLGNSFLFPKTYNRWESLRRGGKDAMKIAFGLVPFFIVAAFLEGFVTRRYKIIPLGINLSILALSLSLIIWYFIIYPIHLHQRIGRAAKTGLDNEKQNFELWLTKKLNSEK